MNLADVLIVAVLVVSVVSAFVKGFFLEVFSLAGVVLGLFFAGANYSGFAPWVMRLVANREAANLIAFLVIALLVMVLAGLVGRALRGLVRGVGLGIVDRIFGAVFGLVKGCIVVTLVLMGIVAFLPRQQWLDSSRLAPVFLTAAHGGSHVVPFELGEKIREGLQSLRMAQPSLLKPSSELHLLRRRLLPRIQRYWLVRDKHKPGGRAGRKRKEVSVKRELDSLVTQMHAGGIHYDEAVREFKRRFILEVLSHHRGNQCKAARELSMHRNTLRRTIAELKLDPEQIRNGLKRPPRGDRPVFDPKQTVRTS